MNGEIFWLELLVFLINIHLLAIRLLGGKMRKGVAALFLLLLAPLTALSFFFVGDSRLEILIPCITVLCYITPLFTVKDVGKATISYFVLLYLGVASTLLASCAWIARFFSVNAQWLTYIMIAVQLTLLITCLTLSVRSAFYRAKRHLEMISRRLKFMLLISVWFSALLVFLLSEFYATFPREYLSVNTLVFIACAIVATVVLIGVMWPFIIVSNTLNASYKSALHQADAQIHAQLKRYELIHETNENLRKFKHDFKNFKIGLQVFLRSSDTEGALRFLREGETPLQSQYPVFETGNELADALLFDKQSTARAQNTSIHFDGIIPPRGLSHVDGCVILGNALDNALDACAQLPAEDAKNIFVASRFNNGFLFISISNPVKEDVLIEGTTLPSSKKDKANHGIGLLSIRSAAEKYDGSLELSCEDLLFTTKIVLDLNTQDMMSEN